MPTTTTTTPPHMASKATPPYQPLPRPMKPPGLDIGQGHGNGYGHRKQAQALLRPHQHTNPLIWCGAIFCVIVSVLIILAGVATLIVFLVIKPHSPVFDISGATLNAVYLDSPTYFNGDLTFLANFSNPNTNIDIAFEYLSIELYYRDRLVAAQGLGPFAQRRRESRLEAIHMISSEVYLPVDVAMAIQKEVRGNKLVYSVRGTFKVRATYGIAHFSYWVYGRCLIALTAPPGGVLVARSCKTKR